jgi:hypothetical protein
VHPETPQSDGGMTASNGISGEIRARKLRLGDVDHDDQEELQDRPGPEMFSEMQEGKEPGKGPRMDRRGSM